ncbi:MAG: elongation factor P [Candidatus Eiseniibacteriota bacterium]
MPVATQLKVGNVILHNGKPYRVSSVLHVTPGNWRGMVQTRLVDIVSGNSTEHRFRSEDKVDLADLETHRLKYMYRAGDAFHFMNTENYGMVEMSSAAIGDAVNYIIEESELTVQYFEGKPVAVEPPLFVELTVTQTEPMMKGATAAASPKPATLETGHTLRVPQYINVGDRVKVDTRDGTFIERV